jgi:ParB family chromosome partitioning protein
VSLSDGSLGRSLNDVLAKTVRREPPRGYLDVDIGLISPSSKNPRTHFDDTALAELAASITTHGVLQPVVVLRKEVGYEIISGERRYRAAKLAGLTRLPVVVRDDDNPQHLAELRLIENLQRSDLNPIEVAEALQSLITEHGLSHEDLASRVNKDRSTVTNALRLLSLPPTIRAWIHEGSLSTGHAKVLAGIADPAQQLALARKVTEGQLSVRDLERLARLGPAALVAPDPVTAAKPPHLAELEANLKLLFGTPVKVKEKNGKGAITLNFHDKDHFNRVVAIMDRFVKQANLRSEA